MTVLETSGAAMKELLHGLRPGDPIFVPSHTEECTVAMAYLLSWKLTLAFFRAAPSEVSIFLSLNNIACIYPTGCSGLYYFL